MYMEKKTGFIILLLTWLMVACSRLEHSHGVPVDVEYVIDRYEMKTIWYEGYADHQERFVRSEAAGTIDFIVDIGDTLGSNAVVSIIKTEIDDASTSHFYEQLHQLSQSEVVALHKQKGDVVQNGDILFSVVPTNHIHAILTCSEGDAQWMKQIKTIMVTNENGDSYQLGSVTGYRECGDESDKVEVDIVLTKTNTIYEQGERLECCHQGYYKITNASN